MGYICPHFSKALAEHCYIPASVMLSTFLVLFATVEHIDYLWIFLSKYLQRFRDFFVVNLSKIILLLWFEMPESITMKVIMCVGGFPICLLSSGYHGQWWHCESTKILWPLCNIKMPSYQYSKSHCRDKTVIRLSYIHNEVSNTGKKIFLYWITSPNSTSHPLFC